MTDSPYGSEGAARQALSDILRDFGETGLDNDRLVNVVLPDLLPESPREASLLRAAASVGVAGLLRARLAQGMGIEAAVRDVAAMVIDRHAIEHEAGLWVVTAYANALGYELSVPSRIAPADDPAQSHMSASPPPWPVPPWPVPTAAPAPPQAPVAAAPGPPPLPAQAPLTATPSPPAPLAAAPVVPPAPAVAAPPATRIDPAYGQPGAPYTPLPQVGAVQPAYDPVQPRYAMGQAGPAAGPQYPRTGPFPAPVQPGYAPAYPGAYPGYQQTPTKSKAPWIFAIVVVLVLVAGGVVTAIELGKKSSNNNAGSPTPSTSVVHTTPPAQPSATPSPTPTEPLLPSDVEALDTLMPSDLDLDFDCDVSPAQRNGVTGVVDEYDCQEASDSTLADAYVYGYQIDNKSDYQADITAINKDLNFDPNDKSNAAKCPAPNNAKGKTTWYKDSDPSTKLGALECWEATAGGYVYLWTWNDNRSIFIVHGTNDQKPSDVETWWENYS